MHKNLFHSTSGEAGRGRKSEKSDFWDRLFPKNFFTPPGPIFQNFPNMGVRGGVGGTKIRFLAGGRGRFLGVRESLGRKGDISKYPEEI